MIQKFMKMMNKKQKGFTLVELMVVVVIIGILVAIAIPVYNSTTAGAKKAACVANLRTLDGAIAQWVSADSTAHIPSAVTMGDLVGAGKYIQTEPFCPSADHSHHYTFGTTAADGTYTGSGYAICPNDATHTYR